MPSISDKLKEREKTLKMTRDLCTCFDVPFSVCSWCHVLAIYPHTIAG